MLLVALVVSASLHVASTDGRDPPCAPRLLSELDELRHVEALCKRSETLYQE